jgi:hypothetical protein
MSSFAVGPDKPLGSQGFTREDASSLRALPFFRLFDTLANSGLAVPADRSRAYGRLWANSAGQTWLYVWDEEALSGLLRDTKLPSPTQGFVQGTRTSCAKPLTPEFERIADAYGDKTNAGRTDVLPGANRRDMLAAFQRIHGFQDEGSWLYFHLAGSTTADRSGSYRI